MNEENKPAPKSPAGICSEDDSKLSKLVDSILKKLDEEDRAKSAFMGSPTLSD